MSQQHSALLYIYMPCQHGPRLEQLHSHSSSSWQHHEMKVSCKKWVCLRLFYCGVIGSGIWFFFEADNFPSELISLQVFPNPFLKRVWSKGIRAKDDNNGPCLASSPSREGDLRQEQPLIKYPPVLPGEEEDKAQGLDIFMSYWWKFCCTQHRVR